MTMIKLSVGTILWPLVPLALLGACGGDKKPAAGEKASAATGSRDAAPTALAMPALGVDAVKQLNYGYGAGAKEYAKVLTAYQAKPRDWAAIQAAAEATLAKDADHLDARWALGEALANTGDPAKATSQLTLALAGDWLHWGPTLAAEADLATYFTTPDGKALLELSDKLRTATLDTLARSPLVLARRSTWKSPKPGTGYASTRGELYAYDVTTKRYLRVTHTDHTLAGVIEAPSGELLLAGFTEAEVPDPVKSPKGAPLLTRSWVSAWSPKELVETSAKSKIAKARFVWAGYGAGDQIVIRTAVADGRWSARDFVTYVVDRATGKLTKSKNVEQLPPTLQLTLDEVIGGATVALPAELTPEVHDKLVAAIGTDERGEPMLAEVAVSPNRARIALASATDPCAKGDDAPKPSLYIADAKTGAYKHVLTAASRFRMRWIDDDHLLYEDGTGSLRFYDAAAGRETGKIGDRAGLALTTLSPSPAPLCTTDPPEPAAVSDEPGEDYPDGDGEAPVNGEGPDEGLDD